MGKQQKSSKRRKEAGWRKRGEPLEEAARAAREKTEQLQRTGGSLASEADSNLFSLETSTSPAGGTTKAKQRAQPKMLWVDRKLAPNPHVPVVGKAVPIRALQTKQQLISKSGKAKTTTGKRPVAEAPPGTSLDIWGGGEGAPVARRSMRPRPPEASAEPAVKVAHEGASYRPQKEAHAELLDVKAAHQDRLQRRDRVQRLQRFEGAQAQPGDVAALKAQVAAMAAPGEVAPATKASFADQKKMTATQRNKQWVHIENLKEQHATKLENKRQRQLGRIGPLLSEIRKEQQQTTHRRTQEAEWTASKRKKLGKLRYETKQPQVLGEEELPNSLRSVPSGDSMLLDRYDSLQERNMIEVRNAAKVTRKRKQRVTVLRESHKDTFFKSPHIKAAAKPVWM